MLDSGDNYSSYENTTPNTAKLEDIRVNDVLDVNNFSEKTSDFFSKYESENKNFVVDFLSNGSHSELIKYLEDFLGKASINDKIKLKNDLKNCKTDTDVKSILIEISVRTKSTIEWYKIWENSKFIDKTLENDIDDSRADGIQKMDDTLQENESQEFWIKDWYEPLAQDIKLAQNSEEDAQEKEYNIQENKSQVFWKKDWYEPLAQDIKLAQNIEKDVQEKGYEEVVREKNGEAYKVMLDALRRRTELGDKYQWLIERTDKGSDQYLEVKSQLENNWILQQLRQQNYSEEYISDYIVAATTLRELKNNEQNLYSEEDISGFDKLVKNLNNKLNIADTNLNSFSSENITQTRTELFNEDIWNEGLIKARNQNMESHDYSKIFPEIWDQELIANYWKFLNENLKEFLMMYQNNPELKNKINNINDRPSTDEERALLKNYQTMMLSLRNLKYNIETRAKNMMEELTIISQIKWMSMCIWQENWKDFNFNKANEIQNENGVLTLNWHIDWLAFSVCYDTNKENAHLQTSSKLGVSPNKETFIIWKEGQYIDSPFIMPSQEEIFSIVADEAQSDSNDLNKYDDINDYFESLQKNVMWRMDKVYSDTELAHHYITNKVKWEKIMDKTISLIEWIKWINSNINLSDQINQKTNPKLYSFLKIINFNIENSTTEEKNKLNQIFIKIDEIRNNYKNKNGQENSLEFRYPSIIEHFLKNESWLDDWNTDRIWLISDMFDYYNKNSNDTKSNVEWGDWTSSAIIINDMYRDLFWSPWSQSEVWAKREKENANDILDLENSNLWESD